jgi:uncharacterized membrane protein YqjE
MKPQPQLRKFRQLALMGGVALVFSATRTLEACTVCMGDPGSREAGAMNAAIFLMLAFIGGVLGLAVAFGVYLHRKANTPLEPHVAFVSGGFNQTTQGG